MLLIVARTSASVLHLPKETDELDLCRFQMTNPSARAFGTTVSGRANIKGDLAQP